MRRLAVLVVAILGFGSAADALTVRDLIELSRAGLGEDAPLAMIEVDGGVYEIDTRTLKSLKEAGVPERVIVAMVRSGRQRPIPEPEPIPSADGARETAPQVVVIDHHDEPRTREVMVPVPIYVPVGVARVGRRGANTYTRIESTYVPFQSGPPLHQQQVAKPEPVYWGFGGKLLSDAWQPERHSRHEQRDRDDRDQDTPKVDAQKRGDKR